MQDILTPKARRRHPDRSGGWESRRGCWRRGRSCGSTTRGARGLRLFRSGFDPLWRGWLARPAGRIVFAGEHTSIKGQGYMNGAIETGLRAAAEIAALPYSASDRGLRTKD